MSQHSSFPLRSAAAAAAASRIPLADVATRLAHGIFALALLLGCVIGAYVVKSKLGINLMPGPSPLHAIYLALR